jgi:MtN3 and saliva related transmembrane protein
MIKDIIGYIGATCLTITLLPQLYKTYKEKSANDISYGFIALNLLTCILFLIYGILLKEIPIILANVILLIQNIILLFLKKNYKNYFIKKIAKSVTTI